MANPFFRFRRFVVWHDRCAMKVGTDGVLLGAWASGGGRVLDVGTGSGLLALMMAQRFTLATIDAVEVDQDACRQAEENVRRSPFCGQVTVCCDSIQHFAEDEDKWETYDAIVSNPPYFENALRNPDASRAAARHADTLPFADLMSATRRLLADEGTFSLVIPSEAKPRIDQEAASQGFFLARACGVHTTPRKPVRRWLLEFRLAPPEELTVEEQVLETSHNVRSTWYEQLTGDFYI